MKNVIYSATNGLGTRLHVTVNEIPDVATQCRYSQNDNQRPLPATAKDVEPDSYTMRVIKRC